MKHFKFLVLVFVLLVCSSPDFAQKSYPLVVRGGGELYFVYTPFSNFSQAPQIWITFKRGPQGVGKNWEHRHTLEPGHGAWLDRPVHGNEPDRIIILNVKNFSIHWVPGEVRGISSDFKWLNVLQDPDRFQSFHVYNDGKGNFVVTKIGPSM
jgi:hypothetical protein